MLSRIRLVIARLQLSLLFTVGPESHLHGTRTCCIGTMGAEGRVEDRRLRIGLIRLIRLIRLRIRLIRLRIGDSDTLNTFDKQGERDKQGGENTLDKQGETPSPPTMD